MSIDTPHVDWFALSPTLILLGARPALLLLAAVLVPKRCAGASLARSSAALGFVGRVRARDPRSPTRAPTARTAVADSIFRDRWAAIAQILIAGCGLLAVARLVRRALARGPRRRVLRAARRGRRAGWCSSSRPANLMTLFLGLEWFSIALYILCAIDIDLAGSLEAGLKYLIVGAVGSAMLLFGSALVYGATGELGFDKIARRRRARDDVAARRSASR